MYRIDGLEFRTVASVARYSGHSYDWALRRLKAIGDREITLAELESLEMPSRGGNRTSAITITLRDDGIKDVKVGFYELASSPSKYGVPERSANFFRFRWERAGNPKVFSRHLYSCDPETFAAQYAGEKSMETGGQSTTSRAYLLDEYQIGPIKLPEKMSASEMEGYQKLAAAVLLGAVKDLIPLAPKKELTSHTRKAHKLSAVSNADRFLRGESSPEDMKLWCELLKISPSMVKRAVESDRKGMIARIKKLTAGTGRGMCKNRNHEKLTSVGNRKCTWRIKRALSMATDPTSTRERDDA